MKKVSVIIACYNKAQYIGNMLESVKDQLWDNIEVIIVNDGSTDNSHEVIDEWSSRLCIRNSKGWIFDKRAD
jgi:glycosyltransferase involved in cell wall biosynthesis